ncbi:MAG: class I SAM-dependent methyltransferase, partial [Candidatus Aminicenantia bacterium]
HPIPWVNGKSLPWDDLEFSKRMLKEHLSQDHDSGSRRWEIILSQIDWLEKKLKLNPNHSILDLGCGPGLYCHELARRGYQVIGTDFAPASIKYAKNVARREKLSCRFILQDIRRMDFREEFDFVLFLYGEFNAFPQKEISDILKKIYCALTPKGKFVAEVQTYESFTKENSTSWQSVDKSAFGYFEQILLHEYFWDNQYQACINRYYIIDVNKNNVEEFTFCRQAYTLKQYQELLKKEGFRELTFCEENRELKSDFIFLIAEK